MDRHRGRLARKMGVMSFANPIIQAGVAGLCDLYADRAVTPLDGPPIGVNANIAVQGLPWHAGIGAYRDRIAEEDADAVARLRERGAIILGTLNMSEGAFGGPMANPWFGKTHNPWAHDHIP